MERIAKFLAVLKRFRVLIISVLSAILLITSGILALNGVIYDTIPCPQSIFYGEKLGYEAEAWFQDVRYEYAVQGTNNWTSVAPTYIGNYKVRAVSNRSFGTTGYGEEHNYTIKPKNSRVYIESNSLAYGDKPIVSVEVVNGDVFEFTNGNYLEYSGVEYLNTKINIDTTSLKVVNVDGTDVTECYAFTAEEKEISFTKRDLVLSVDDLALQYNGFAQSSGECAYTITSGSLAFNDRLSVSYVDSLTDVGASVVNATARIVNSAGENVSDLYNLTIDCGTFSIIARELLLNMNSQTEYYNGLPLENPDYEIADGYALVSGHSIEVISAANITEVGEIDNTLELCIVDAAGNDVTSNYDVKFNEAKLIVEKRPITFVTVDRTKTYDGVALTAEDGSVAAETEENFGLVGGHKETATYTGTQTLAGESDNEATILIEDGNGVDVTGNYEITYEYGTLLVEKRAITVTTHNGEKVYDGIELKETGFDVDDLAAGDTFSVLNSAELLTVDCIDNIFTEIAITSASGEDVWSCYELNYVHGTLTVSLRTLKIKTLGESFIYNGSPQKKEAFEYDFSEFEVVDGQEVRFANAATVTNVGDVMENVFDLSIFDGETETTDNYEIIFAEDGGELSVLPKELTLRPDYAEKVYDGDELTADILSEGLIEGHVLEAKTSKTIVDVQELTDNQVLLSSVKVTADGIDVTGNYAIDCTQKNSLKITPRPLTIKVNDQTEMYSGRILEVGNAYECTSIYDPIFVKDHAITAIEFNNFQELVGACDASVIISSVVIAGAEGDVTNNYEISSESGRLEITVRPITVQTYDQTWVYDGNTHAWAENSDVAGQEGGAKYAVVSTIGLVAGETLSVNTKQSIVNAGSVENDILFHVIDGNNGDRFVDSCYDITVQKGTLTVEKRPILITTATATKEYDGTPLSAPYGEITSNGYTPAIVAGETYTFTDYAAYTNVTEENGVQAPLQNLMQLNVVKADGSPSSDNYEISWVYGTLMVYRRSVTVTTESKTFIYNGGDQMHPVASLDRMLPQHHYTVKTNSCVSIKNVTDGIRENRFEIEIKNAQNVNQTDNYTINYVYGTLQVNKREVHVITDSGTWEYDDMAHSMPTFTYAITTPYQFVRGLSEDAPNHTTRAESVPTITDYIAGGISNSFSLKVYDRQGVEVGADNYDIHYSYGTLLINKREITVTAGSASKEYDGVPLVCHTATADRLVAGHNLSGCVYVGEIIEPGQTSNVVTVGDIINTAGHSKINNYNITYANGTLTISKRNITFTATDSSKTYDGTSFSHAHWSITSGSILSQHECVVTITGSIINVGSVENVVDSVVITDKLTHADVTDVYYNIIKDNGTLTVRPRNIGITTQSGSKIYDGTPLSVTTGIGLIDSDGTALDGVMANHYALVDIDREQEISSLTYVTSQTSTGGILNKLPVRIYDENGVDITSNYTIQADRCSYGTLVIAPRPITVTSLDDEKVYDGIPLTASKHSIAYGTIAEPSSEVGLIAGDEVFAFVDGETSSITNVGETTAKVRILSIKNGAREVVGSYYIEYKDEGTLKVTARELTYETPNETFTYDGFKHSDTDLVVVSGSLAPNQRFVCSDYAEIMNVGTVSNTMNVKVVDTSGNDVSNNYVLTCSQVGTLEVTACEITVTANSASKVYDGRPLEDNGSTVFPALLAGHYVTAVVTGSITDYGSVENVIDPSTVRVWDANDVEVTGNYSITCVNGTLTITKKLLTIKAADDSKVYDGTPLTNGNYEIVSGSLANGHSLEVLVEGSITDYVVGGVENRIISVVIRNGNGDDVTNLYEVTTESGRLMIDRRVFTIATSSASKIYDGTPLIKNEYTIRTSLENEMADGHEYTVTVTGTITEIGSVDNTATIEIFDIGYNDVSFNYDVRYALGTLTIKEIPITWNTGSAQKPFDGTPLTCSEYEIVNPQDILSGHYYYVEMNSEQTLAGSCPNYPTITIRDTWNNDVTRYYTFVDGVVGRLTVSPLSIDVETGTASKDYDGEPLRYTVYTQTSEAKFIVGFEPEIRFTGEQIEPGTSNNTAFAEGLYADCYNITWKFGTLTVIGNEIEEPPVNNNIFKATAAEDVFMYFRVESFGAYNSTTGSWVAAMPYDFSGYHREKINPQYLAGYACYNIGETTLKVDIEAIQPDAPYVLPYYSLDLASINYNDTFIDKQWSFYTMEYIPYGNYNAEQRYSLANTPYNDLEMMYREYVADADRSPYTLLDAETRAVLMQYATEANLALDTPNLIEKIADLVRNYRPQNDEATISGNVALKFFSSALSANNKHFATAATAMYRAMGIPARYVEGYAGDMLANETREFGAEDAHAWVEVYINGFGWRQIEVYNGNYDGEDIDDSNIPREFSIKPKDISKEYDGTPLDASVENLVVGVDAGLNIFNILRQNGYTWWASVVGSRTAMGVSESEIVDFKLYDSLGNDVTYDFLITYEKGEVKVTTTQVTIQIAYLQKQYDGKEFAFTQDDYYVTKKPNEVGRVTFDLASAPTLTEIGVITVRDLENLAYHIYDKNGFEVTENYHLNIVCFAEEEIGTDGVVMRISERKIEITSGSRLVEYTGTPLRCDEFRVSRGSLAEGHSLDVDLYETITHVGVKYNYFTYSNVHIKDRDGNDVTHMYDISTVFGLLEIVANE